MASLFLCWELLTGTPLNGRTAVVLVVLPLVLRVVEVLRAGYKEGWARSDKAPKRVFLRDPGPVLRLDQLGAFEYHKTIGRYVDKWITVAGNYEGSAESLLRDSLSVSLFLADGRRVNLQFSKEHEELIRQLRPGQRITIICQCCLGSGLALRNAELAHAEPLRRAG